MSAATELQQGGTASSAAPPRRTARSRLKWIVAILLLAAAAVTVASYQRRSRLNRLAEECAQLARRRSWSKLESTAREWLDLESDPGARYWLGMSLKGQSRHLEAEPVFALIPFDGPRGIDAATERMEIQFHVMQQPLRAMELANRLLQVDPRLASPRRHRIYFAAMCLQRARVLEEIRAAIKDHVDVPEHYVYLVTLEDLAFRDAAEITGKWAEASPDSEFLQTVHNVRRLVTARAAVLSSPSAEATSRYRELQAELVPPLEQRQHDPIALDMLLLLAMDEANVERVGRLLSQVPDEAADDPTFWRYRGWYATRIGDYPQARESYEVALKHNPLGSQTRHEYAALLRLMQRPDEAAREETIASEGTKLVSDLRRFPHAQSVTPPILFRIADYARNCGDFAVANGIVRRLNTPLKE